jgi:ribosome-binding factor A
MSGNNRAERVAGEIQSALSSILRDGLKDPRVGPLTLTTVRVSADLRVARINFVPLGGDGDPVEIVEGLESALGFLRRQLGRQLRLRHVPELHFHLDTHLDQAMHMTDLLDQLSAERAVREGGEE